MAVVFKTGPEQTVICTDGRVNVKKKLITLIIDDAYKMIILTLWPQFIEELDAHEGKAVSFQNLTLEDYNNKFYLESSVNTIITKDGTEEAIQELSTWFDEKGCDKPHEELRVLY